MAWYDLVEKYSRPGRPYEKMLLKYDEKGFGIYALFAFIFILIMGFLFAAIYWLFFAK